MNTYTAGQVIRSDATFTVNATGLVIDPGSVTFKYAVTYNGVTGATTTLTYTGSPTPAPGTVARTGPGIYEAQVDTTAKPGYWAYEWITTGAGQTSGTGSFLVEPLPL